MNSDATAISAAARIDRERSLALVIGTVCLAAALAFVFRHFLANQIRFAFRYPADWGHTLIIPFMAGYLVYLNRGNLMRTPFRITWIGLVPIVLGVAWYMFVWVGPPAIKHHNLMAMGFGATLFGVLLLMLGWRAMKYLWFPLLYLLLFGVRISDQFMNLVTYKLQDIAARGSWVVLRVLQYDADIRGNTLSIFHNGESHPLNIAEACAGMRMLVAFLALGVFLAYTGLPRTWQRVTLVILAVPVAVFVNVLRVVTLGLLSLIDVNFAAGDFHTFVGLIWLVPALLIYLLLMWILRRIVIEDNEAGAPINNARVSRESKETGAGSVLPLFRSRRARLATAIACVTLLVCGVGFEASVRMLQIHLQKDPVPLRSKLSMIPRTLGDWERFGEDRIIDESVVETLGTDQYLTRAYTKDDEFLVFHVTYYTDQIDAVPHVPERCYLAGGLTPRGPATHVPIELDDSKWVPAEGPPNRKTGQPYRKVTVIDRALRETFTVRLPINDIVMRLLLFQVNEQMDEYRVVGYFFIANGIATPDALDVRGLAFDQSDQYAYYCKVEFSMVDEGDEQEMVDRFVRNTTDLLNEILPHLLRCLPDWWEVENGLYPAGAASDRTSASIIRGT